jgi:hypothetical protein
VWEEAQGRLQQECVALEGAQETLKQQDEEVSQLDGELNQLSVSHEDMRQALEEQEATVLSLRQATEDARKALDLDKKRVEGEWPLFAFRLLVWFIWDPLPILVFCSWFSGLRNALGNSTTQAEYLQTAYNSSQQELEELRAAALEACQGVEEGDVQAGSSMASRLRALGRHVTQRVCCALHLGIQKALGVVVSHYQVDLEAVSTGYVVPVGVDDEVVMDRADALTAPAADILFPDAPPAGGPQA